MEIVSVVALGIVDEEVLASVEVGLWQAFGVEIRRLSRMEDPTYAFDSSRLQYSSAMVLRRVRDDAPSSTPRVLAVTERDLFIPMLSFVFGQAQVNGKAAVISIARLRQEFYGLKENRALLISRATKEATHEVGHTFGLTHCTDSQCPMSLSNNIMQVDKKSDELCGRCSIILNEALKRNVQIS